MDFIIRGRPLIMSTNFRPFLTPPPLVNNCQTLTDPQKIMSTIPEPPLSDIFTLNAKMQSRILGVGAKLVPLDVMTFFAF